jgi:hypothetical protein
MSSLESSSSSSPEPDDLELFSCLEDAFEEALEAADLGLEQASLSSVEVPGKNKGLVLVTSVG